MNKNILVSTLALAGILGAGVYTTKTVYAQEVQGAMHAQHAQRFAERFNLDVNEVTEIFQEQHKSHMTERQQTHKEALNNAVSEGKITETQKEAFLGKIEEMRSNFGVKDMQDLTPQERQERRQEHHEEIQAWAEQNGIDISELMPRPKNEGFGGGRGFGKGM